MFKFVTIPQIQFIRVLCLTQLSPPRVAQASTRATIRCEVKASIPLSVIQIQAWSKWGWSVKIGSSWVSSRKKVLKFSTWIYT